MAGRLDNICAYTMLFYGVVMVAASLWLYIEYKKAVLGWAVLYLCLGLLGVLGFFYAGRLHMGWVLLNALLGLHFLAMACLMYTYKKSGY